MSTYTQTDGSSTATYFMDVEISPVTLADGSLRRRFNPKTFPKVGTKNLTNPTISSVTPSSVTEGTSTTVTVAGTGFQLGATVGVSGAGVTVTQVNNTNHAGHALVCSLTVAEGAAQTSRTLTVTNPDGGTATHALTVGLGTVTITSVTPSTKAAGTTGDIVVAGTGFEAGLVATFSGAGITVNSTTRNSATQATVNITVAGGAATTARDVTLTNTDSSTATATGGLTVT